MPWYNFEPAEHFKKLIILIICSRKLSIYNIAFAGIVLYSFTRWKDIIIAVDYVIPFEWDGKVVCCGCGIRGHFIFRDPWKCWGLTEGNLHKWRLSEDIADPKRVVCKGSMSV